MITELNLSSVPVMTLSKKIYQGLAACKQLNESNPNAKGIMTINGGKQIYFTEK